jgi:hypothetical protein
MLDSVREAVPPMIKSFSFAGRQPSCRNARGRPEKGNLLFPFLEALRERNKNPIYSPSGIDRFFWTAAQKLPRSIPALRKNLFLTSVCAKLFIRSDADRIFPALVTNFQYSSWANAL